MGKNYLDIIYYLPGLLFIISSVLQIIKLLKRKSSTDISIWTYILTFIAIFIIEARAISICDLPIIVSNGSSLFGVLVILVLLVRYK